MKKIIIPLILSIVMFTFTHCSNQSPVSVGDSKSVTLSIATPPGFDTIAHSASVRVSGAKMDTINQQLTISSDSITGTIRQIPAGSQRFFEVEVYGMHDSLLYYGSAYADIYPGEVTKVNIALRKPGGTAVINGRIEDYPSDSEFVTTPQTPVLSSIIPNANWGIAVRCTTGGSYSSIGHGIQYGWKVATSIPPVYDSSWDSAIWTSGNSITELTSAKGKILYFCVKARCALDTLIQSNWSQPLRVVLNDSIFHDTVPKPDTGFVPPDTFMFSFPASAHPFSTGISLYSGDKVSVVAAGNWSPDTHKTSFGPEGDSTKTTGTTNLYQGYPLGALMGGMSTDSSVFFIGDSFDFTVHNPANLNLFLNYKFSTNQKNISGGLTVEIKVYRNNVQKEL